MPYRMITLYLAFISDAIWIELIRVIPSAIGALLGSLITLWQLSKVRKRVDATKKKVDENLAQSKDNHALINGRTEQLLAGTCAIGHVEGVQDERQQTQEKQPDSQPLK